MFVFMRLMRDGFAFFSFSSNLGMGLGIGDLLPNPRLLFFQTLFIDMNGIFLLFPPLPPSGPKESLSFDSGHLSPILSLYIPPLLLSRSFLTAAVNTGDRCYSSPPKLHVSPPFCPFFRGVFSNFSPAFLRYSLEFENIHCIVEEYDLPHTPRCSTPTPPL